MEPFSCRSTDSTRASSRRILLRGGCFRHILNLDTGPALAGLKGLFGHFIMREGLAAVATTVPVEPGPVIVCALVALFIAPPAPFGDPLRQHIHDLTVLGL